MKRRRVLKSLSIKSGGKKCINNNSSCFSLEDVKVYFHQHNQFLDLSGRMGYKVFKGETVQTQVSWQDVR